MDTARDHFLARAGLSQQQCRPPALAKFLNQTENLARTGRLPHQNVTGFFEVCRHGYWFSKMGLI
jgi:hypothetical protein